MASRSRRGAPGEDVGQAPGDRRGQRLYRLVDLPAAGRHTLELELRARDRGLRVHLRLACGTQTAIAPRASRDRAPAGRSAGPAGAQDEVVEELRRQAGLEHAVSMRCSAM